MENRIVGIYAIRQEVSAQCFARDRLHALPFSLRALLEQVIFLLSDRRLNKPHIPCYMNHGINRLILPATGQTRLKEIERR